MRSQLWQRLRNLLAEWEVPAVHASVFGSAARADGDAASDIDIFLVRPADIDEADPGWADQVDGLRSLVARWTGNEASIVEQSEQSLDELLARHKPRRSCATASTSRAPRFGSCSDASMARRSSRLAPPSSASCAVVAGIAAADAACCATLGKRSRGLGVWLGPLLGGAAITLLAGVFSGTHGYQATWGVCDLAILAFLPFVRRLDE